MKKVFSLILVAVMAFSFASCKSSEETKDVSSKPQKNTSYVQENVSDYSMLKCRSVASDEWKLVKIQNPETYIAIQLQLPKDWKIKATEQNTLNILRDDIIIGSISTTDYDPADESFQLISDSRDCINVATRIDLKKTESQNTFYRHFEFTGTLPPQSTTIKMQVYYGELDEDATHKIMMTATCPARAVPLPEEAQTNGSDKILLLGNSFINSSDIGNFLDKMLDSQESFFSAEPKAYAMASVSRFTSDNQIMFEIARGNYAYVFLCGFYSDGDIEVLHLLKERCEYSNTKLVIFPAHNENRTIIDKAVLENQDLYFLDWKGEIDALIQSGIDPSLLYVNDTHKHSTKLAGYVGAMMIYKALYGTALSDIDIDLEGNQNFNEILKSYIESNGTIDGYTAQIYNIQ